MKLAFEEYHFISAYALTSLGALVYAGLLVSASPMVRRSLHTSPAPPKRKLHESKTHVGLIFSNAAVGSIAAILLNLALDLGSPTIVNALRGVQYAAVFVIVLLLSRALPNLLDEQLNRSIIVLKLSGIVLVANGVVLIALSQ
jgi:hypothetical protein